MNRNFDVAVVGLGAVGSAALYQLARRGVRAIGIDRFSPPHDRGSSHGETRITRQAVGEGEAYVPLVLRSNQIWEELEAATGMRLLERCGFLFIARGEAGVIHHGKPGFLAATRAAAVNFGIAHELLSAHDLPRRFPQFTGRVGDETAYYEPGGGFLRPENCIAAHLAQARAMGAAILVNTRVEALVPSTRETRLVTPQATIVARRVVVATGGWLGELAGPRIGRHLTVYRQQLHWFNVEDTRAYGPDASPSFIWSHGFDTADQFYGFPPIDGAVKVAQEVYDRPFDPDSDDRVVDPAAGAAMVATHVGGRLAGLAPLPSRSQTCHYAVTPDSDFMIVSDGDDYGVQLVSACSGHGFKHAAAVGEAAAQRAMGEVPTVDLSPFGAARFR